MPRIPSILFKYLPPERFDVLTGGRLRVSQRQVVNDFERDFQPPYLEAAPPDMLARYLHEQVAKVGRIPEDLRPAFVQFLIEKFGTEMLEQLLGQLKSPDLMGMVSLTDDPASECMWCRYAACRTGFVLALDTRLLAGTVMPRLVIRRVEYSDEPIRFVSAGITSMNSFFRKNTKWASESEWRGVGVLSKFPIVCTTADGWPIHACTLPAGVVRAVIIRKECTIDQQLSLLLATDCRYRSTAFETMP